jgi:hypothetical protein
MASWRVQDKKVKEGRNASAVQDEMTMEIPNGLKIGTPSAWADTFRPSVVTQDRLPRV